MNIEINSEVNQILEKSESHCSKRDFRELLANIGEIEAFQTKSLKVGRENSTIVSNDTVNDSLSSFSNAEPATLTNVIDQILDEPRIVKKKKVQIETGIMAIEEEIAEDKNDERWDFALADTNQIALAKATEYKNIQKKSITAKKFTRKSTKKWSADDKTNFYKGLELFGLDYTMISEIVLTNRSTREIAAFLWKEDKRNQGAVDKALKIHRENKPLLSAVGTKGFPSLEEVMKETAMIES